MFYDKIREIGHIFDRGARDLIGIDFGSDSLKIAHVRISSKKNEVMGLFSRNITGMDDITIAKSIGAYLENIRIKNPDITSTISSNLVITKNIEIPSSDPKEIREIINLQAGRHTPYSRDEIVVDYIDIGVHKHNYTKILLVIAPRGVIKRQFDILDRTGLKLNKISFAPEALAWGVAKLLKTETMSSPISVVQVDEVFTDFTIVFKDKIIFIRSIPIGARQLVDEREKHELRFVEELSRSLEAYQSENIDLSPNLLALTGATEGIRGIEVILNNALHMPVKIAPYFNNLQISSGALKTATILKYLSFLNVIAPLLAKEEIKLNLIPEEIKLRKSFEKRGRDLIKTGILVLITFILVISMLVTHIFLKSMYLKKIEAAYGPLSAEAQELEKYFSRINLVRKYLSQRSYPLEVLAELYDTVPDDMEVSDIRFAEEGRFSIKGTAESMSSVFTFVEGLQESEYFKNVKTRYTSKRKEGSKDVTDFEIISSLLEENEK